MGPSDVFLGMYDARCWVQRSPGCALSFCYVLALEPQPQSQSFRSSVMILPGQCAVQALLCTVRKGYRELWGPQGWEGPPAIPSWMCGD